MQGKEENEKTKEKNSFRRKERSVFKKCLTGPTLLEMSGWPTYQSCGPTSLLEQQPPSARHAARLVRFAISGDVPLDALHEYDGFVHIW
jgi:hypothetical protein